MRCFVALLTLFALPSLSIAATPFTVDDMLRVTNANIADVSADGRWVAVTVASLEDRIGINNHRFGDPTYIAPSRMDLLVIDTQNGTSRKVFPERTQVRGAKWSPDGSRLALFVLRGDAFQPPSGIARAGNSRRSPRPAACRWMIRRIRCGQMTTRAC
jgi:hypothetical protein